MFFGAVMHLSMLVPIRAALLHATLQRSIEVHGLFPCKQSMNIICGCSESEILNK